MNDMTRPGPARLLIAVATLLGGGSLLLFGLFLFFGPLISDRVTWTGGRILAWDAALLLVFCVQHSAMVRSGFRDRLRRFAPPELHGAIFSVASGVTLLALTLMWVESPVVIHRAEGAMRWMARAIAVGTIPCFLWASRSIPHFDPLGVGPIKARLRGKEPRHWPFAIRGPYRWVRHPQYLFALVLVWSYPDLTADRLLFNLGLTAWVVLGTILEERDLVLQFGDDYVNYQNRVPMLVPWRPPAAR